jgi:hypothetical protein
MVWLITSRQTVTAMKGSPAWDRAAPDLAPFGNGMGMSRESGRASAQGL